MRNILEEIMVEEKIAWWQAAIYLVFVYSFGFCFLLFLMLSESNPWPFALMLTIVYPLMWGFINIIKDAAYNIHIIELNLKDTK